MPAKYHLGRLTRADLWVEKLTTKNKFGLCSQEGNGSPIRWFRIGQKFLKLAEEVSLTKEYHRLSAYLQPQLEASDFKAKGITLRVSLDGLLVTLPVGQGLLPWHSMERMSEELRQQTKTSSDRFPHKCPSCGMQAYVSAQFVEHMLPTTTCTRR